MNIDKHLENVLGLAPAAEETKEVVTYKEAKAELVEVNKLYKATELKSDFTFVREKMREAIDTGSDAMIDLLNISKSSQSPDHFNALAALIKALNETNRNLIDHYKKIAEIEALEPAEPEEKVVNNNLIVDNSSMVMDLIKNHLGVSRGLDAAAKTIVLSDDDPGLQTNKSSK